MTEYLTFDSLQLFGMRHVLTGQGIMVLLVAEHVLLFWFLFLMTTNVTISKLSAEGLHLLRVNLKALFMVWSFQLNISFSSSARTESQIKLCIFYMTVLGQLRSF